MANPDGTGLMELTGNDPEGMHTEPQWSADGKKIGYSKFLENGARIMQVDVASGETGQLNSRALLS